MTSTAPVLMLGCRKALLRASHELGRPAVVVHGPWEKDFSIHMCTHGETRIFVEDITRTDFVLAALARHGLLDARFAGMCVASDEYVVTAAILSQLLDAPRVDPKRALTWKDKSRQKTFVKRAGLATADFMLLEDVRDCEGVRPSVSFPAVLKPIASAGTVRTYRIEDEAALADKLAELTRQTEMRTFLLESFVPGRELIVDGIVSGGRLVFFSLCSYLNNVLDTMSGKGAFGAFVIDPREHDALYRQLEPFVVDALKAIDVTDSVFHMEIFRDADGHVAFGECGVRLGGWIHPELVARFFGVDLAQWSIRQACGEEVSIRPTLTAPGTSFGAVTLPTRKGVLRSCPSADDVLRQPNVTSASIERVPGTPLSRGVYSTSAIGYAMLEADSIELVERRAAELSVWFEERVIVDADADPGRQLFKLYRKP